MLDIKKIKENPDAVKAGLRAKEVDCDATVDRILELDELRRQLIADTEARKAQQNKVSKEIPLLKKQGKDVSAIFAEMAELKKGLAEDAEKLDACQAELRTAMLSLPNLPDPDLKPGGKENNEPLRYFGESHKFDFEPKHHVDLCLDLGLIDYERGVKLAGSGNWMYTGMGARLEWALLNYFIDTHIADGYDFILPPHMLEYQCGETAGQFPKFADEVYKSPTPPTIGFTTCCPPQKLLCALSSGMRFCRRTSCPRSTLPTPPASVGKPVLTGQTSGAWFAAISSTRWRCSSSPAPKIPTRHLKNWSARQKTWSRVWASTSVL